MLEVLGQVLAGVLLALCVLVLVVILLRATAPVWVIPIAAWRLYRREGSVPGDIDGLGVTSYATGSQGLPGAFLESPLTGAGADFAENEIADASRLAAAIARNPDLVVRYGLNTNATTTQRARGGEANGLLVRIARCPVVDACLGGQHLPCRAIVRSQGTPTRATFHLPQPWAGDIENAPILFVSSNPSINADEDFPTWSWTDERIVGFFKNHFDPAAGWSSGDHLRLRNGTLGPRIPFWAHARALANELLDEPAVLGSNLAMTEVVHCKSKSEAGVEQALDTCADRYLVKTVSVSGARVVVVIGRKARGAVERTFPGAFSRGDTGDAISVGPRPRVFAYMGHSSSGEKKRFATRMPAELARLRRIVNGTSG